MDPNGRRLPGLTNWAWRCLRRTHSQVQRRGTTEEAGEHFTLLVIQL
ncbi:MAG: hypothetical protein R2838_10515 [Caldilineaceae bacterium]